MFISALLLLPKPRRELSVTPEGEPHLQVGNYTVAGIDVDIVSQSAKSVTFAPTAVWGRSRGGLLRVDFSERMATVTSMWNISRSFKTVLAGLIKEHEASANLGNHDQISRAALAIQKYFKTDEDVLPLILSAFGPAVGTDELLTGVSSSTIGFESEDDSTSPAVSRRERAQKWRRQADRGPGAREFSRNVREAYNYRCLFSGERFPRLEGLDSAGVDGAHILPWSTHNLNAIQNGICLCKQCHWAFDSGLLRLDFSVADAAYIHSIPDELNDTAIAANCDLPYFQKKTGLIEPERLPVDQKFWPSTQYISEINENS